MNIETRMICGKFIEAKFSDGNATIETGTLDKREARGLADELFNVYGELVDYINQ